jgi:hypothetical protein
MEYSGPGSFFCPAHPNNVFVWIPFFMGMTTGLDEKMKKNRRMNHYGQ